MDTSGILNPLTSMGTPRHSSSLHRPRVLSVQPYSHPEQNWVWKNAPTPGVLTIICVVLTPKSASHALKFIQNVCVCVRGVEGSGGVASQNSLLVYRECEVLLRYVNQTSPLN